MSDTQAGFLMGCAFATLVTTVILTLFFTSSRYSVIGYNPVTIGEVITCQYRGSTTFACLPGSDVTFPQLKKN